MNAPALDPVTMPFALQLVFVALLAVGVFFALVGSIGLLKLSDTLRRLHGPTKATTLGVGGVLIASMLHHWYEFDLFSLRELLITLFLFLTAPVSAHLMAKASMAERAGDREPGGGQAGPREAPMARGEHDR